MIAVIGLCVIVLTFCEQRLTKVQLIFAPRLADEGEYAI